MILPDFRDHEALRRAFRWQIPPRYNIAEDVCDRWALSEPDRTALLVLGPDDRVLDGLQFAPVPDHLTIATLDGQPRHVAEVRPEGVAKELDVDLVGLAQEDRLTAQLLHLALGRLDIDTETLRDGRSVEGA